jgi:serine/threonine-protein kinase
MAAVTADRHLPVGLIALQHGIINQGQLLAAFQAWTLDRAKSLADHLAARGDLDGEDRAAVEALAALHLKRHGGDVQQSLAALNAGRSTRDSLVRLADGDIEASLAHVGATAIQTSDDVNADRTTSYSVGAATSDGQRFRLLRPHARGGLGEVFVALDAELHREVALKQILEKHADDPVSRQRFVAEAEITGGLEHPGIVPVYGFGTYGSGRPYYAMRFIKGDSLKEAIESFHQQADGNHAPRPPCPSGERSPQHVAGEGAALARVSTRPLTRPSGTLSPGGEGDAKSALALRKLLRRFLDVCNAIDYAHCRGVIHRDIKPANIILGKHGETLVVDWGLAKAVGRADPSAGEQTIAPSSSGSSETVPGSALGTPAYMSPEQAAGDLASLGPRSDVYSLGATLYCLLTGRPPFEGDDIGEILRRVQSGDFRAPREGDPALDQALEAVCKKAMAQRPADRYASPRALSEDIERWMADEPVSAWREPISRRVRRWANRNRTTVASAAVALCAGVVGLAAVLAVQTRAKAEVTRALAGERDANRALAASNLALERSTAAVQARYELAVGATQAFHTGVSEDFLLKQDQFKELRDRLLRSAQDFYGKLSALLGRETDLPSRRALLTSNFELADLTGKVGSKEDALKAHRAVLAAREALAAEPGAGAAATVEVGRSLTEVARLLEATGKTGEAVATYRRSESLLTAPAGTDAAARAARAACRTWLGSLLSQTGQAADALAALRQALADQEALAAVPGASAAASRDLATTVYTIGKVLMVTGKPSEAEAEFRRALEIRQKLADDHPAVTDFRYQLAGSHHTLGLLLGDHTGKLSKAEAEYRQALEIYQKLAADQPAVAEFRRRVADIYNNLGEVLMRTGKLSEAEAELRRAMEIDQKLAADHPAVTDFRSNLASDHSNLGLFLASAGRPTEAEGEFRRALEIGQKVAADNPAITHYRDSLSYAHNNLGDALRSLGRAAEARDSYDRAIALKERRFREAPTTRRYRYSLAWSLRRRGLARRDMGDLSAAAADARRALALWQSLPSRTGQEWFETACARAALAGMAGRAGSGVSAAEGITEADAAMTSLYRAVGMGYRSTDIFRSEDALGPLRGRDDFRLLILDVAFPVEAFARGE